MSVRDSLLKREKPKGESISGNSNKNNNNNNKNFNWGDDSSSAEVYTIKMGEKNIYISQGTPTQAMLLKDWNMLVGSYD